MQLLTIELGDFGGIPDDTLRAIDTPETTSPNECFQLSIHALAGTAKVHLVRLRALVKD